MGKVQQLAGFMLGVGCLFSYCVDTPTNLQWASNRMLGVALMCGWFWVFEVLPIYVTALLPVIMMPLLSITSSQVAAAAYWSPIHVLIVGTYLVDIALEEVQLPRRVAVQLLRATGVVHPGLIIFLLMLASFALSMVCNNIAVALMIAPFAIGLTKAAEAQAPVSEERESSEGPSHEGPIPRFSAGLRLGVAYSSTAGGMASLIGCIPNELLRGDDAIAQQIGYTKWMLFAFPVALAAFLVSYIVIYLRYIRSMDSEIITRKMLEDEYEEFVDEVGPASRDDVAVAAILVLQFTLLFGGHWIRELDFFRSPDGEPLLDDSTFACLPAVFLFVIPSVIRPGQSLLTWPVVHERFDFGLLLLIGGGFAIAKGFAESGLNAALGDWLATVVDSESDVLLTFLLILVCTLSTQVFSALGTATTVLPVLKAVAARSVHNPLALVLPATIACSFAFMLPTAAPCNIVVLAKSRDLAACHHRLLLCVHVADRRPVQHRGARQVSRPCRAAPRARLLLHGFAYHLPHVGAWHWPASCARTAGL